MDLTLDVNIPVEPEQDLGSSLRGDISVPAEPGNSADNGSTNKDFNTLDEPILDTITRDLKAIGKKIANAMAPKSSNVLMKEWDLWGPLIMCTYIGLILQSIAGDGSGSQFTQIFVVFWLGVAVITYHFVIISSSKISIFQCICVLGYCLGPLAVAVTLFESMHVLSVSSGTFFLRLIISSLCAVWSSMAAVRILATATTSDKKYIALAPVIGLYVVLSLLILYNSAS